MKLMVTKAFHKYQEKLLDLRNTITDCNNIIISDNPTGFVYDNANFLTKSFLITLCGYLESYLKDVLEILIIDYNDRIKNENYPYNLIRWSIENKDKSDSKVQTLLDKKKTRFENLEIKLKKKDLDSFISGNPFRTNDLFKMFGFELDKNEKFIQSREKINLIVTKRNNILHHNDSASDISNSDILSYIEEIEIYSKNIDEQIESKVIDKTHCI
ncbi:HEPN domain-containing protein [uncultured Dokdonia sp.]|uniref:HEPN domain-containing protein n=1 Tax=uncultured Dokdonia sp. TaxID=575653 RepID=UPI00262C6EE4|nr:HEPN domain-containing protein [uncultured Dokdonia sp.]